MDLFDWSNLGGTEDSAPLSDDDVLGENLADETEPRDVDGWPTCEVCGDAIEWSGRGRRPKKCLEHRRRVISPSGAGPVTRRASKSESDRLVRLEMSLAKQGVKAGAVTARMLPVTGVTMVRRSENAAAAIVKFCADKPQFLDALEKVAKFEAVMDIAEFIAAIVVAVGVDMGQVHPEGLLPQMLDVTSAWQEVNAVEESVAPVEEQAPQYQGPTPVGVPQPPMFGPGILPKFEPIGVGV